MCLLGICRLPSLNHCLICCNAMCMFRNMFRVNISQPKQCGCWWCLEHLQPSWWRQPVGVCQESPDVTLKWRHNECHGVSNYSCPDCLLRRWFRRRFKNTSKLRVTGLCEGNKRPVAREYFHLMTSSWCEYSPRKYPTSLTHWPLGGGRGNKYDF